MYSVSHSPCHWAKRGTTTTTVCSSSLSAVCKRRRLALHASAAGDAPPVLRLHRVPAAPALHRYAPHVQPPAAKGVQGHHQPAADREAQGPCSCCTWRHQLHACAWQQPGKDPGKDLRWVHSTGPATSATHGMRPVANDDAPEEVHGIKGRVDRVGLHTARQCG